MDKLKALRAFLSKVLKMTDGDIDAILDASEATEETVLTALLEKDKDRVALLTKSKPGQTFQDGYKKAKAEVLTAFEKEVREKYGVDDETLTGVELVAKVIETEAAEAGKKVAITDDVIKKHPLYLRLEKESKKALTDKETEWKGKLEAKEKEFKKAESFGSISTSALDLLMELNPVLSTNPKVAATQQADFLREFKEMDWEKQTDGSFIAIDAEGKRLEDAHGHPITLEDLVKQKAENRFDFKANNGGENPGDDPKATKDKDKSKDKKYPANVTKPKSIDELAKIMNDGKLKPDEKAIVMEVWESENPNA